MDESEFLIISKEGSIHLIGSEYLETSISFGSIKYVAVTLYGAHYIALYGERYRTSRHGSPEVMPYQLHTRLSARGAARDHVISHVTNCYGYCTPLLCRTPAIIVVINYIYGTGAS